MSCPSDACEELCSLGSADPPSTICWGFIVHWLVADTHDTARYLNDREKYVMRVRQAQDRTYTLDEGFSWVEVRKALADPVIWVASFTQLCVDICLYGFATFAIVIIKMFGYGLVQSQALTAPVYFCKYRSGTETVPKTKAHLAYLARGRPVIRDWCILFDALRRAVQGSDFMGHSARDRVRYFDRWQPAHGREPHGLLLCQHGCLHLRRPAHHLVGSQRRWLPQTRDRYWHAADYR